MRVMRIMVMFDLPTGSKAERKSYSEFRKFLVSDGYIMEQFSVYSRVTLGMDNAKTHFARLKAHVPLAGRVTAFLLTERQYMDREVLVCTEEYKDEFQDIGAQTTLFF